MQKREITLTQLLGLASNDIEHILDQYEEDLTGDQQTALRRALELVDTVYVECDNKES